MRAANVAVKGLSTVSECMDAIAAIERDPVNTVGGLNAMSSGQQTFLTASAQKKIEAIDRKIKTLVDDDDEEGM